MTALAAAEIVPLPAATVPVETMADGTLPAAPAVDGAPTSYLRYGLN